MVFIPAFVIALCKVVYLPIVLAIFFIPTECFKNKKDKYVKLIIVLIISGILAISWYAISNIYLAQYYGNSSSQKEFIFKHPIEYCCILIRTMTRYFLVFIQYSSRVDIPPFISFCFWMLVIIALFTSKNEDRTITNKQRFIYAFITISTIVLIETAIYIQFTAMTVCVGNDVVDGIQSRYFLPVIILTGLIVKKKRIDIDEKKLFITMILLYVPIFLEIYKSYLI